MPVNTAGLLVNTLTLTDLALMTKLNNVCLVYPNDSRGRQQYVPARMTGPDEEFKNVVYPSWTIIPDSFEFDMRRFCQEKKTTTITPIKKRRTEPDQPYLLTYRVNGYAQDVRVFREMQEFLGYVFPPHAFLEVEDRKFYINRQAAPQELDYPQKELVIRSVFSVWVTLEVPMSTDLHTVYNDIVIGFTNSKGRFIQGPDSTEEQIISV